MTKLTKYKIAEIEKSALQEIAEIERRAAIERAKERILARRDRPWWRKVFPFKIERV